MLQGYLHIPSVVQLTTLPCPLSKLKEHVWCIREPAAKGAAGMETPSTPDTPSAREIPHLLPGSSCYCLGQILHGAIACDALE